MPSFESALSVLLLWAGLGYLFGSIPFGILLSRIFGLGDLRNIGSGNIGATNVLRTGNKLAAALTLVFDAAKGAAVLLLARSFAAEDAVQIAAFAAFVGHCYPVWLGFKGGKGVATFLGIMLALAWPVGLACCATWIVGAALTRMSSMSAILAASFSSIWLVLLGYGTALILTIILTILVFWRHSANIARIRAGTEPKIGQKG
ncbi:glycerol-3-phosphate 1-O-acyltransferase PlsY [Thalassococcus sp. S3]|uniref:glycerol-3-phosphate 1-O-acyltransferase PlsY n=1 Tax=Thalassococcus sp. S3 TaxID=2017482 RepID=UPI0010245428|nr:glycerol-3-phosphate 1-O-acyltransferase PlsY [Thalassococcus sp. S3]QBF33556.1 acyl-phosphate glycerol 3-phosphate acyltransferase [Thalassococcus sp. S3]